MAWKVIKGAIKTYYHHHKIHVNLLPQPPTMTPGQQEEQPTQESKVVRSHIRRIALIVIGTAASLLLTDAVLSSGCFNDCKASYSSQNSKKPQSRNDSITVQSPSDCPLITRADCYKEKIVESVTVNNFPPGLHTTVELQRVYKEYEWSKLHRAVRVLCLVLTVAGKRDDRSNAVKETWGKRCNRLVFLSSKNDPHLGSIDAGVKESRSNLWRKVLTGLSRTYKEYAAEVDWFFKSDDDTYVIMENLRHFLSQFDPRIPLYFGFRFNQFVKQGYMSGGGGYVISRAGVASLLKFNITRLLEQKRYMSIPEDSLMGQFLQHSGVLAGDSRDAFNRSRFHPLPLLYFLQPKKMSQISWMRTYEYYPTKLGKDCCSSTTISTHYISPGRMRAYDYLIYTRRSLP